MSNRTRLLQLCATLLALVSTSIAAAHPQDGPHVDVRLHITDTDVRLQIGMNLVFLDEMLTVPREHPGEIAEFEIDGVQTALLAHLRAAHPLTIDGVVVDPTLTDFTVSDPDPALLPLFPRAGMRGLRKIHFVLRYTVKSPPASVGVVWAEYPPDVLVDENDPPPLVIKAEMVAQGLRSIVEFTHDEPEFIWHRPGEDAPDRFLPVPRQPTPTAATQLAILPIIMAVVWLAAMVVVPRMVRGTSRAVVLTVVTVGAFGVGVAGSRVWEVEVGGGSTTPLPTDAEARSAFVPLHANIYRAFDFASEADIYDALARSVDGALLDRLYNEVYHSLIMQDEGGAVSRVDAVRQVTLEIEQIGMYPGDASEVAGFQARYRWQVDGSVYHWGHSHERTNEYEAVYTVVARDGEWRIADNQVIEQLRIEIEPDLDTLPDDFEF